MKKIILSLTLVYFSFSLMAQELNVMTFNIRLNIATDSLNAWPYRKDKVTSQILFHEVQLLGVQEALHDQMIDLKDRLTKFKYAGGGRDDGKKKGNILLFFMILRDYNYYKRKCSGCPKHRKCPEVKAGMRLLPGW